MPLLRSLLNDFLPLSRVNIYKWYFILAFLFGIVHTQAFAPFNLWWLQLFSLAGLFYVARRSLNWKRTSWLGWAFGLGWFTSGIWWLYISMHIYGGMPAPLAILAVVLLSAALGLFPAFALWSIQVLCSSTSYIISREKSLWLQAFTVASIWGLSEWLRGTLLTGFPWLAIGYAHTDGPLAGYAAFIGVYGVSTLAAWISILLSYIKLPILKYRWYNVQIVSVIFLILITGWAAQKIRFTRTLPQAISVRLIQGNIPQDMKFDPIKFHMAMQRYTMLMTKVPADLIVAPETVFPVSFMDLPTDLLMPLHHFSIQNHSQLLFGAIGLNDKGQPKNSLFTLSGYYYDKSHLVPFGEFIPLGFAWFMDWMNMPLGNFSRGARDQLPLKINGTALAPNICYEDLFGEEIARNLRAHPAHILVNASNIAWFGNTRALDQHLQIARFRSLETQLPTLRATNTGMTAWIDNHGLVREQLPRVSIGSLAIQIHGYSGLTPYVRWGNTIFLFFTLLIIIVAIYFKNK